jgi:hypothetical protein
VVACGVLTSKPGPATVNTKTKATASLSAQQILLTAAVSAARQPARGRYWRVADINGSVIAAGPNAHPYAVEQTWKPELTWDARSPGQRTWTFPSTGYSTVPATAGAAAAWKADGSPKLPTQRSSQQGWWQTGGTVGYFGNSNLTFAQFQALPASPAGLAAAVRKAAQEQNPPLPKPSRDVYYWGYGGLPTIGQDMFSVYEQLLMRDPISPQVRAAVFRGLAELPGVRSIGRVTDPLGRTGYGIALSSGPGGTEEVLVIAPGSGMLLTDEFVTVSSSPPKPVPPSGAGPGLSACPKGTALPHPTHPVCLMRVDGSTKLVGPGPLTELAPGQVQSFDAIVSEGWTDASPTLPPRSQQFSVTKDGKG